MIVLFHWLLDFSQTYQFADIPIRGHDNSRTDNSQAGQFVDVPIHRQDVLRTHQFVDCGQFPERCFTDKRDYSRTNCLKSPPYLLPLCEQRSLL